jgi:hypothetical protein
VDVSVVVMIRPRLPRRERFGDLESSETLDDRRHPTADVEDLFGGDEERVSPLEAAPERRCVSYRPARISWRLAEYSASEIAPVARRVSNSCRRCETEG